MTVPPCSLVVDCPACRKRLKLNAARYQGKRLQLRCPGCGSTVEAIAYPRLAHRALVAHPDPEARRQLCERISHLFDRVDVVEDAQRTLAILGIEPPDLLLMDVTLPGMLSFELIDRIHDRAELSHVRIVLLSESYRGGAYRRPPRSFYGADGCVDLDQLDELPPLLARLFLPPGKGEAEDSPQPETDRIRQRMLRDVERLRGSVDDSDPEQVRMLARLIVTNIVQAQQRCLDDPLQDVSCLEQLTLELEVGRQVLSRMAPAVRRQTHDYIRETFENFIRQRRLERAGAYYPGVEKTF